jgi:hypothetical protein
MLSHIYILCKANITDIVSTMKTSGTQTVLLLFLCVNVACLLFNCIYTIVDKSAFLEYTLFDKSVNDELL